MSHYFDPITKQAFGLPVGREQAIKFGTTKFIDVAGCDECRKVSPEFGQGPKARYLETGDCVGCYTRHALESWQLWEMGMPGGPDPFPKNAEDALKLGMDWYYGSTDGTQVCDNGPHFRRTDVKTKKCLGCAEARERAKSLSRGPRAAARASGQTTYTPLDPCGKCGQRAPRNVATDVCRGCAIANGRPDAPDLRKSASTILAETSPDMILDRDTARAFGLTLYRTGTACRKGHTGWRYVSTGNCFDCLRGEK